MSGSRLSLKVLFGVLLALAFGIALYFRVYLPYEKVFTANWIKFTSADAYYHMRLVDNLVHNFPHITAFDPYFIYPGGEQVTIRFFDWLLAAITWLIGLGSPTQQTVNVVAVYFPAILGALNIIPVYFIGKELFGRWAGVLAAGLLAILPGEFLGRSILGFTDHHIAETLFSSVSLLFLILAIKTARQKQLTFGHVTHLDWGVIKKPVIYSTLAGLFMGLYFLTWMGALLFAFIIFTFVILQFIIEHVRGRSSDYLSVVSIILFFVTLLVFIPFWDKIVYTVSLGIALVAPLALSSISWLMRNKQIRQGYYPLVLATLGLAGLGLAYLVSPSLVSSMLEQFKVFVPQGTQLTTIEMQPLLYPQGTFNTAVARGNFTTGFYLSLVSLLIILVYFVIKQGNAEKGLLLVWSLVVLAAALGQRRFAYYYAINVALLTSYLSVLLYYILRLIIDYLRGARTDYMSWRVLELPDFNELVAQLTRASARAERKRASKTGRVKVTAEPGSHITITTTVATIAIVFFVVFFPNINLAIDAASQARFAPSDAWMSSLDWLEENTPEPFGDPDAYYALHETPPPGESYQYPDSAYGVLAWWDYGYWITRIAHRIPNANPSQDPDAITSVASFFTAQDEETANEIARELETSYVIIDFETATGKFHAVATWAGKDKADFFDVYLVPEEENRLTPRLLYYPEYYRSVSTRLYNFNGSEVVPETTLVISYEERADEAGTSYRVITDVRQFTSYEEAETFRSDQESANYRIIGVDPFTSPVPLEALEHYRLANSSDNSVAISANMTVPAVKIFEYLD